MRKLGDIAVGLLQQAVQKAERREAFAMGMRSPAPLGQVKETTTTTKATCRTVSEKPLATERSGPACGGGDDADRAGRGEPSRAHGK